MTRSLYLLLLLLLTGCVATNNNTRGKKAEHSPPKPSDKMQSEEGKNASSSCDQNGFQPFDATDKEFFYAHSGLYKKTSLQFDRDGNLTEEESSLSIWMPGSTVEGELIPFDINAAPDLVDGVFMTQFSSSIEKSAEIMKPHCYNPTTGVMAWGSGSYRETFTPWQKTAQSEVEADLQAADQYAKALKTILPAFVALGGTVDATSVPFGYHHCKQEPCLWPIYVSQGLADLMTKIADNKDQFLKALDKKHVEDISISLTQDHTAEKSNDLPSITALNPTTLPTDPAFDEAPKRLSLKNLSSDANINDIYRSIID